MPAYITPDDLPGVHIRTFKQAPKYSFRGIEEVRGFAWHFAQGGGTDDWLTRTDGAQGENSCHVVIKYDGSIRQLVRLTDASWSLHWSTAGNVTDFGIFSIPQTRLLIPYNNPLRYIIAMEVEGYWATGPNDAQRKTILDLARWLESQFPKAVHMGHRDFQDYKACPGPSLFTNMLPHHGRLTRDTQEEPTIMGVPVTLPDRASAGSIVLPKGTNAINLVTEKHYTVPFQVTRTAVPANLAAPLSGGGWLVDLDGDVTHFVRTAQPGVVFTPYVTPADSTALRAAQAEITRLRGLLTIDETDDKTLAAELRRLATELEG
jgi:hypothetical protein